MTEVNDDAMRSLAARLAEAERLEEARLRKRQKAPTDTSPARDVQVCDPTPATPGTAEPHIEVVLVPSADASLDVPSAPGLVELWLRGYHGTTQSTYRDVVRDYERTIGEPLEGLLAGRGRAHGLAAAYRVKLLERNLAPNSVNLRIAALRSFINKAGELQIIDWVLKTKGLPSTVLRDTRGPGVEKIRAALKTVKSSKFPIRDAAFVWLMFALGLRRGEVASLRLEDVDLEAKTIKVAGKGSGGERVTLTITPQLLTALAAWLAVRGPHPGSLFGLTARWIGHHLRISLGIRAHGFRHTAITETLRLSNGNVRAVQRFSRHKDMRTVQKYDDAREDMGAPLSAGISLLVDDPSPNDDPGK